jgi:hypothetical protein
VLEKSFGAERIQEVDLTKTSPNRPNGPHSGVRSLARTIVTVSFNVSSQASIAEGFITQSEVGEDEMSSKSEFSKTLCEGVRHVEYPDWLRDKSLIKKEYSSNCYTYTLLDYALFHVGSSKTTKTTDDDHLVALDLGSFWMHFPPAEKSAGTWTFHPPKDNDPTYGADFTTELGYFPPMMLQCIMPGDDDDDDDATISSCQEDSDRKSSETSTSTCGGRRQGSDVC